MVVLFVNSVNSWDKMSYVHEKYEQSKKGGEKKTTKAVVAMLCKMKTISLLEYFILF